MACRTFIHRQGYALCLSRRIYSYRVRNSGRNPNTNLFFTMPIARHRLGARRLTDKLSFSAVRPRASFSSAIAYCSFHFSSTRLSCGEKTCANAFLNTVVAPGREPRVCRFGSFSECTSEFVASRSRRRIASRCSQSFGHAG